MAFKPEGEESNLNEVTSGPVGQRSTKNSSTPDVLGGGLENLRYQIVSLRYVQPNIIFYLNSIVSIRIKLRGSLSHLRL